MRRQAIFSNIGAQLRATGRAVGATAALLATAACGGAQGVPGVLGDRDGSQYLAVCEQQAVAQAKDLQTGAYNPATLFVHLWPQGAPSGTDLYMPESRLVAALEQGDVRRLMVIARGGLGKTRLAEAVRAQTCNALPTFFVDLKDVAKAGKPAAGRNAVLDRIAADSGLQGPAAQQLYRDLAEVRWLVFLDAMEEVDLVQRPHVLAQIADLAQRSPQVQLVYNVRPPVLDENYGFGAVDAVVEIPKLDCKVTDAFVARAFKADEDRRRFSAWLTRQGLDEKGRAGPQCVYPYLATYRDIQTLAEFEGRSREAGSGITTSRATVYEYLVAARLRKEFANLGWSMTEALDMVDRMVRVQAELGSLTRLELDMAGCEKAIDATWGAAAVDTGVAGTDEQRRRHICEKMFQSALFEQAAGSRKWVFADRATADLFLARWLNGQIARGPGGDCAAVAKHTDVLAAPGVTRFFVGQPFGQRCLAHVVAGLCSRSGGKADANLVGLLDQGLPVGRSRVQPLQDARAMSSALEPKGCIASVLDDLDKTVASR